MRAVPAGDSPDFYPRPPRGGRLSLSTLTRTHAISIHALREEGDFVPNRLLWEHWKISIHALREEGDWRSSCRCRAGRNFYPRPPRGGRRHLGIIEVGFQRNFYPRPPRGGRL